MIVVSFDLGLDGAIAVLHSTGYADAWEMPRAGEDYDRRAIYNTLEPLATQGAVGVMERVWGNPTMGGASAFRFGQGYELAKSAFTFFKMPFTEVLPAHWKRFHSLPKASTTVERKRLAIAKCLDEFPTVDIKRVGGKPYSGKMLEKIHHDGKADALLIGLWRKRQG